MKKTLLATLAAVALSASSAVAQSHPAMLIGSNSMDDLNFQEKAAADFFVKENPDGVILTPADAAKINPYDISYIWIHIDRLNVGKGNLPAEFTSPEILGALQSYSENGGSLLLTKHATQLLSRMDALTPSLIPTSTAMATAVSVRMSGQFSRRSASGSSGRTARKRKTTILPAAMIIVTTRYTRISASIPGSTAQ